MILATSDLHGNLTVFETIKKNLGPDDTCIVLGDACDRGEHGIEILLEIKEDPRFEYIIGNHDDFILRTYRPDLIHSNKYKSSVAKACWLDVEGNSYNNWETLRKNNPDQFNSLIDWLANCDVFRTVVVNDIIYRLSHAKYPKSMDNVAYSEYSINADATALSMSWKDMERKDSDLLFSTIWNRYIYESDISNYLSEGCISLIGHTPFIGNNRQISEQPIYNLDCYYYSSNDVTVFCLDDGKTYTLGKDTLPNINQKLKNIIDLKFEGSFSDGGYEYYTPTAIKRHYLERDICLVGHCTDSKRKLHNSYITTSPIKKCIDTPTMILFETHNTIYRCIQCNSSPYGFKCNFFNKD